MAYRVGFGRPPLETRFKKGRSGNPGGRPKKRADQLNLAAILERALSASINAVVAGQRIKLSRAEAMMVRMVSDAAHGDPKAQANVLRLLKAFPLPLVDKDRFGEFVDHSAEVRARIEAIASRQRHAGCSPGDQAEGEA